MSSQQPVAIASRLEPLRALLNAAHAPPSWVKGLKHGSFKIVVIRRTNGPIHPVADPLNKTLNAHLERWQTAMDWRRQADKELAPLGLTLLAWLVLDATVALIRKQRDAVSQKLVSDRTHLDKGTVSRLMQALEQKGYVDRAPEYGGPANRVWVTDEGKVAAARCRAQLAAQCLEAEKQQQRADLGVF